MCRKYLLLALLLENIGFHNLDFFFFFLQHDKGACNMWGGYRVQCGWIITETVIRITQPIIREMCPSYLYIDFLGQMISHM